MDKLAIMHDGHGFKQSDQFFKQKVKTSRGERRIFLRECRALYTEQARISMKISRRKHPDFATVEQEDFGLSNAVKVPVRKAGRNVVAELMLKYMQLM